MCLDVNGPPLVPLVMDGDHSPAVPAHSKERTEDFLSSFSFPELEFSLEGYSQHHVQVDLCNSLEYRLPLGRRITLIQGVPALSSLSLRARFFCKPENPRIFKVKDPRKHVVVDTGLTIRNRVCISLWVFELD